MVMRRSFSVTRVYSPPVFIDILFYMHFRAVFIWLSKSIVVLHFLHHEIGLKKLAPLFRPIRSETNRDSFEQLFPRSVGSAGLCSKNRVLCFRASPTTPGYYAQNYAQLEVLCSNYARLKGHFHPTPHRLVPINKYSQSILKETPRQ